ncbi:hypothetical protein G9F32_16470 [Acinetobacter sp. 194]|uniref:hypothetical protein n=1 Tax=Acinetobacter shaoyimingii TaxID=2715164 RepID=UPI00140D78F3|nr:hypothetical protein [Acinetobacter shaoyimingii]NHB59588.1 hypothetical protein [Acinetobacter shaoyimingii]
MKDYFLVNKILIIENVVTYIEDYCCVVSFASDLSSTPESYLILTRQSSEINGGRPIEKFEWDLQIDYDGEISELTSYTYNSNDLLFVFDYGGFTLDLKINKEIDLKYWLDFIFKNQF